MSNIWVYEPHQTKLHRAVDGDTYEIVIDYGHRNLSRQMYRLNGIDTPEIYRPKDKKELERGRAAKEMARVFLEKPFRLISLKKDVGIYGRWLCDIEIKMNDGTFKLLAELLAEAGFDDREENEKQ